METFKANPDDYDLVVTDMAMPKMTGDKLSKEILSIRSNIMIKHEKYSIHDFTRSYFIKLGASI